MKALINDEIREFTLRKYLTGFIVSSLGKERGADLELKKPAL